MDSLEIIQRCRDLYEDFNFNYVREWKNKTGGKAIGIFPIYFPKEVIHAAGALPVELYGGGDLVEVVKGDSFYQSYICHIPRSLVDLGLTGKLDVLEGIISPFTCDVVRNFSGVWKLLFPNKYSRFFDQPQNFDLHIGGEYLVAQLKEILEELLQLGCAEVSVERLNESFRFYNLNRHLIRSLYDLRAEKPWLVPADEVYLLMRAGNILEISEFNQYLADYLDNITTVDRKPEDKVRVVISGAFCEQPSVGLLKAIELSGCYIVDDDFILSNRYLDSDIETTNNPLQSLAKAYLASQVPSSCRFESDNPKTERLIKVVKERKAEGVIFAAPSFCDPALQDRPFHQQGMEKYNIPFISLQYAEDTSQFGSIREQIGTFTDSIRLWEA